ncbi:MAG: hypothetical protein P1U68_06375 [Verrucomicrobiales bacterium]|nr:hypothetical protein [Verrucomicrobiales bacterium]
MTPARLLLLLVASISISLPRGLMGQELTGPEDEVGTGREREDEVPESLQPWVGWVTNGGSDFKSPRDYSDPAVRFAIWCSRLELDATESGAEFSMEVAAFQKEWLSLPGSSRLWPQEVTVSGVPVPVLEREGRPAIQIAEGSVTVKGHFEWPLLPQQITLPPEIGLLDLVVKGAPQENPSWDSDGTLWLQRQASSEPVDEDFLSINVFSKLEDGIPLWFETRIELIVAGKSREETLGTVLPKGWKLASISAPVPVAIDDRGLLKSQLRPGRWSITLRAFQINEVEGVSFSEGVTPAVADQSVAFEALPEFRQSEVIGLPQIDVAQTQVPAEWRTLPIYRWDTAKTFQLIERVRGSGEQGRAPLKIQRSLWLDGDGSMLTYQDKLSGPVSKVRRLDAAEGHALGSVSVDGEPQLITHNPDGGAPGFEVRSPQLSATATGRIQMNRTLPATGWQADADGLTAVMQLPPGYRLFALFGADYSRGDWLTSWTLLDLFLLLLFTLAVFRLQGLSAALIAFAAFGLAYHEPGAPRIPWLLLLIPVALVAFMPEGRWRKVVMGVKWGMAGILLLSLLPFITYQIQGAVFPQLERKAAFSSAPGRMKLAAGALEGGVYSDVSSSRNVAAPVVSKDSYKLKKSNLKNDPDAVIQTGPGVPSWTWRTVEFGWKGPVSASEEVRPILIPPLLSRFLAVLRVLCLVGLLVMLLTVRRKSSHGPKKEDRPLDPGVAGTAAILVAGLCVLSSPEKVQAQFPNAELLNELRARVTEPSDAFPGAAGISSANLQIEGEEMTITFEYHAADRCAVPVPLPLGACIPVSAVFADGSEATLLRKEKGIWVLLPEKGIRKLTVRGKLRDVTDWEWGFALKPRRFSIEAEGWSVSGVRPDGSAEDQILFSRSRDEGAGGTSATYDRPDTGHALLVERQIELGLVWRVKTTVSRLSPTGRAVVIRVPVLPGEKVVSAGRSVEGGSVEVRLAPAADSLSWEGELSPVNELTLSARDSDSWTEQWRLVASPVWNVSFAGLSPTFVVSEEQLVPLWQPWPGESATISVSRPEAVAGAAVTIDSAKHHLKPGRRQRLSTLNLSLRTSLGEDFAIQIPTGADVTSLKHFGKSIPVRKEGDGVVVPLRPGAQNIEVEWRIPGEDRGWTRADGVVLPVESANVTTLIQPADDRWIVLLDGPLRGPAVRFWGVLVFAILAAFVLSRVPTSPLRMHEWLLLCLGLTQIPVFLSVVVVAWLFFVQWRGSPGFQQLPPWSFNLCAGILIFLTMLSVGIFFGVASSGLLGDPQMYVAGNGSTASYLQWFSERSGAELPQPGYWSVSIWWFRLAMLLWALWLAAALVRWLRMAWRNSAENGHFKPLFKAKKKTKSNPPELPKKN